MARERMITRTVEVTVAEVMCIDVTTAEVTVVSYDISGKFSTKEDILKSLKKAYETETYKIVNVQSIETKEILYGMPEIDFIRVARVLPPRGTQENPEEEIEEPVKEPQVGSIKESKKSKRK